MQVNSPPFIRIATSRRLSLSVIKIPPQQVFFVELRQLYLRKLNKGSQRPKTDELRSDLGWEKWCDLNFQKWLVMHDREWQHVKLHLESRPEWHVRVCELSNGNGFT